MKRQTTDHTNVKSEKRTTKILLSILLAMSAAFICLLFLNRMQVEISFRGEETVHAQYGMPVEDPGADAVYTGSIFRFIQKEASVKADTSKVNTSEFGTYEITYTAEYEDHQATRKRKVIVEDTLPPVLTLVTDPDAYTLFNHSYEEEGYTAIDNFDGDITDKVTSEEEAGYVYYRVEDSHGNIAREKRKIVYDDRKGPVIKLKHGEEMNLIHGEEYKEKVTAEDDLDGDVTDQITSEGSVDSNTDGDYTVTYSVSDAHGNRSEVIQTVHVIPRPVNNTNASEGPYVIYLTFDDGPGQYTDRLLEILDKYNVKATFFTTSAYPNYAYCIGKEAAAGHTVAVHTRTHNYGKIYASTDAYWSDFNAQNEVVNAQTGSYANIFRFPGGSSNTVSRNYCKGIMTTLASQSASKGLVYFDWNVSSGDAGEVTSADAVYSNVTSQVAANTKYGKPSVVLQHDVKGFSVDAVERIIQWGLKNGYSFLPLSASSYTAHHGIAN